MDEAVRIENQLFFKKNTKEKRAFAKAKRNTRRI